MLIYKENKSHQFSSKNTEKYKCSFLQVNTRYKVWYN